MGIAKVTIHPSAMTHNFNAIKKIASAQKILAMIKGNGYGHGILAAAEAMSAADAFGVSSIDEAFQVLKGGVHKKIVVMRGFYNKSELFVFKQNTQLIPVIHHIDQIKLLETTNHLSPPIQKIWVKIDTGMHRLGFRPKEVPTILSYLHALGFQDKHICLMTHLADADNAYSTDFTEQQISTFNSLADQYPNCETSIHGSAGLLNFSEHKATWARPGCLLYGASPFAYSSHLYQKTIFALPAMTLTSKLISIQTLYPGETIGYGCSYSATKKMEIGVVGMGYGDGYPRLAPSGTPVLVNGTRCATVGRVSMDMLTIDLSNLTNQVAVGDEVMLWGPGLSVNEVAESIGTIAHELVCKLMSRVTFVYEANHIHNNDKEGRSADAI